MKNTEQNLKKAEELLTDWNKEASHPEPNRLDVVVTVDDLRPAVTALHGAKWGYLSAITGLDLESSPARWRRFTTSATARRSPRCASASRVMKLPACQRSKTSSPGNILRARDARNARFPLYRSQEQRQVIHPR
jgi:hypothetical protein